MPILKLAHGERNTYVTMNINHIFNHLKTHCVTVFQLTNAKYNIKLLFGTVGIFPSVRVFLFPVSVQVFAGPPEKLTPHPHRLRPFVPSKKLINVSSVRVTSLLQRNTSCSRQTHAH